MNSSPHTRMTARAPLDIIGGLLLVLLSAFALYYVRELPAAGRVGFSSGTAPRLFAYGLLLLGLIIAVQGFMKQGEAVDGFGRGLLFLTGGLAIFGIAYALMTAAKLTGTTHGLLTALLAIVLVGLVLYMGGFPAKDRFGLRATFAILGAVLFFGLTIRYLGLFITGIPMVIAASAAAKGFRPVESVAFAVGITIFCALLFSYTLGQPIPLWPNFR